MPEECVFCKIANGEIPDTPVFENEEFVAFRDVNPQAPVHVLLIPRAHIPTIMEVEDPALIGRAMQAIQQLARQLNIHESGFRTVINNRDDGGQTVYHLHIHLLGGRFLSWPPG